MNMKKIELSEKGICEKNVIVLGNFDGVHIGHKALIEKAGEYAKALGASVVCWTFEKHPLC